MDIPGELVEQYIDAFIENWAKYESLKATIPNGGEFTTVGKMGMTIRIGSFFQGVCLQSYHMPVNTREKLDQVIADYRYAMQRALQVQELLAKL